MEDLSGREIDYMRFSVTDRCNLRCKYCMPNGIETVPMSEILTFEEIVKIVESGAILGIKHIKITGGEPLVRRGLPDLIAMIKSVPSIEDVSLTTNGVLLKEQLEELIAAGLDSVNISLDTIDRKQFHEITGFDYFERVMESIKAASESSLKTKINVVSLIETDVFSLIDFSKTNDVDVRFIELMPIGKGKSFSVSNNQVILNTMRERFPGIEPENSKHGNGPAVYYKIPGFRGSVGFISAMHGKFCSSCNRIRITSRGYLKSCLCYEKGVDLMPILRGQSNDDFLLEAMKEAICNKPASHCFEKIDEITESKYMVAIGG